MEPEPKKAVGDSGDGANVHSGPIEIKTARDVRLLRWLSKRQDWKISDEIYENTAAELDEFWKDKSNSSRSRLMAKKMILQMHAQNAQIAVDSSKLVPADSRSESNASQQERTEQIVPASYLIPDRTELEELAEVMREVGMLPGAPTDLEPGQ